MPRGIPNNTRIIIPPKGYTYVDKGKIDRYYRENKPARGQSVSIGAIQRATKEYRSRNYHPILFRKKMVTSQPNIPAGSVAKPEQTGRRLI